MKHIILNSLICLSILSTGCISKISESNEADFIESHEESQYIEGRANILVSEEMAQMLESAGGELRTKSPEVNTLFDRIGVISYQRLFPYAGEFEARTRKSGLHKWYKIIYNESVPTTKAQEGFEKIPGVEIFEPERMIKLDASFNDPKSSYQWHYLNNGNYGSEFVAGADINVTSVWENYTVGSRKVTVAVIDAGVDYEHEDIAANYVGGINFGTGGKVTPDDHGTHVAGTIAAVNNNGIGVSGIAGGNAAAGIKGVGILGCQIFSGNNPVGGAEAIKWAADNGANIANNSWGHVYGNEEAAKKANIAADLKAAIDYFIQYAGCDNDGNQLPDSPMKGGVILFSSGNYGWRYNPIGEYEPVVAVGSIGPDMTRAYYSCYGDWVDIAAPGGDAYINRGMIYSTIVGNRYDYMQGTSMSCPHATGVAALIASYFGGPGFSNDMLLERLLGGARYNALPLSANIGPLVDALGSFTMGSTTAPDKVEDFDFDVIGNKVTLKVVVTADKDDIKTFEYAVLMAESPERLENIDIKAIPEGVKEYRFKVGDVPVGEIIDMVIPELEFDKKYYFTVTGCDYSLNYAEFSPVKAVVTGKNQAPVIMPAQEMTEFTVKPYETLSLDFDIYDPEGGEIKVKLAENRSGISIQKKSGSTYTFTITGSVAQPGTYECAIQAIDSHGLVTEVSFTCKVLENSAPVSLKTFEDIFVEGKDGSYSFDLTEYFSDPDGETLTYKVAETNKTVSINEINDNKLNISIKGYGLNTLAITACDFKKASCSLVLRIASKDPQNLVEMYPVPVTDVLNIRTGREKETGILIKSASGHVVHESKSQVSAFDPAVIEMKNCAPGRYMVTVVIDGQATSKVITKI